MTGFRILMFLLPILISAEPLASQTVSSDTAFQRSIKLEVPDSSGFAFATFTVPAGKHLIIRYLAVTATLPSGERFTSSVQATLHGDVVEFPQAYLPQSNGDGTDEMVSNQIVTIQADGDTTVYFQVFRRVPRGSIRVVFALSGDLISSL